MMSAAAVGMEGFMVSSVRQQVLCQAFWASGCVFLIFGLKKTRNTITRLEKDIPFYCDRPSGSLFSLKACISKFNNIHHYVNYSE